jgi:hypothetical protein
LLHQELGVFSSRQLTVLIVLGVVFWALAAAQIRWLPTSITGPASGVISFVTALPVGWLSVRIARRCAALDLEQLPAGIVLSGGIAMMIDGAVLHWAPQVYGQTETLVRLAAAWLLWGYGVALTITFLMSRPKAMTPPLPQQ